MRACLMSLTYDHALRSDDEMKSNERALTVMGTDVEQAVNGLSDLHEVWGCSLEMGIAIYLLWKQIGPACAAPVGICTGKIKLCTRRSTGLIHVFKCP